MEREGSFRRSLHSKLKLASGSSSSLTDLSQAKTPAGGGGERGGTAGGLTEECNKDKGTQQRRAGANATWN
ncbi:proline-rich protein 5-like protein, partial [Lates japonicus]